MEVLKAINAVSAALSKTGIEKNRQNREQGYNYRGIDDYLNALSPLLAQHGVVVSPEYSGIESVEVAKTQKGNAILQARVIGKFTLFSVADGSSISATVPGEGRDSADKAINKAMSTAYKYMAAQVFCIPFVGMEDTETREPEEIESASRVSAERLESLVADIKNAASLAACKAAYELATAEVGNDEQSMAAVYAATKARKAELK